MALEEYKKKRTFERTPEPDSRTARAHAEKAILSFVVQEHHARRLHYDFRLELDGVLKSWAVPKGPSMNPEDKRLAVMVEDHPLDYGGFEGTIPKGNYGAGEVKIWDKGVYNSGVSLDPVQNAKALRKGLDKGHIDFVLYGEKLRGAFSLIKIRNSDEDERSSQNSWLLIKQKDGFYHERREKFMKKPEALAEMPHNIKPMLATLAEKPFDCPGWLYEVKWDGYRAIAEIEKGKINLYSRNGISFNERFKRIGDQLKIMFRGRNLILDGEIIAVKRGSIVAKPDFHSLQNYDEKRTMLQYILFDLLYIDGIDLRSKPLIERKKRLEGLLASLPPNRKILFSEHIMDDGVAFFESLKKEHMEGMIAKDGSSAYEEGRRSKSWVKVKNINEQEAIILGYTEPKGTRKRMGALVLGAYENVNGNGIASKRLRYIGHSGGGFSDKELQDLHNKLKAIEVTEAPIDEWVDVNSVIHWVRPKFVCEIRFTEWTPDMKLRHPIYSGLRDDKTPDQVVIEKHEEASHLAKFRKSKSAKRKKEHLVKISNPDKIYWPKEGITKQQVIDYYGNIADTILPYLRDRPESLNRHPDGIDGANFYHKDVSDLNLPKYAKTHSIWSSSNSKEVEYLLCQNKETLAYMANLGCIEINPWSSRIQSLDHPDFLIIDLDPGENTFDELITVAHAVHDVLSEFCEYHYVKTSGKTGLHICVPVGAQYDYDIVRLFSELVARIVNKKVPEITSLERSPKKRTHKIYLDYLQNRRGQTIAAPYSLRPYPGATVSTPLEWNELKKGFNPAKFNMKTIQKRLKMKGDLWESLLSGSVDLDKSIEQLKRFISEQGFA